MALNDYIEQTYQIECLGRNVNRKEVLETPVAVNVVIYKSPDSNTISSRVECIHNTGSHGEMCKASHSKTDKVGEGITCPYSFDIPYALDRKRR